MLGADSTSTISLTEADLNAIADRVWQEPAADHNDPGTMGELQNMIDDIGGGGGCCHVIGESVVDHFAVVDPNTGSLVPGIDSTSFDVKLFDPSDCDRVIGCGGDSTALDISIVEIDSTGLYRFSFVPDQIGVWIVSITHSTYFPSGKSANYMVVAESSGGGGSNGCGDVSNDDLLAFILGLY
jgi:hypothetical protein